MSDTTPQSQEISQNQRSNQNFFELLGVPPSFTIDPALLDQNYRKLQSEVHPDRFVSASSADQLQSMQLATLANDAYRTLKHPTSRARYLLQLQGIETLEESNTAMPADFLMLQMEWREALEESEAERDIHALDSLVDEMSRLSLTLQSSLATELGDRKQWSLAAETVRKLSFIDKVRADVGRVLEKLENEPLDN